MKPPQGSKPDLETLVSLFYDDAGRLGTFEEVDASAMPLSYRQLLAHEEHMTVTVEEYHRSRVDVRVLETHLDGPHYSRRILLARQSDGVVVQFGIVRLNFDYLSEPVRREIEQRRTPLGRILIEHNVLRQVQLVSLWKIQPGPDLCRLFNLASPRPTYGRTALIYCDGEPAVELLEIVTPA